MRLPNFVIGMLFAMAIVGGWSVVDHVSAWMTIVRLACTAIVVQVAYFCVVLMLVRRAKRAPAPKEEPSSPPEKKASYQ